MARGAEGDVPGAVVSIDEPLVCLAATCLSASLAVGESGDHSAFAAVAVNCDGLDGGSVTRVGIDDGAVVVTAGVMMLLFVGRRGGRVGGMGRGGVGRAGNAGATGRAGMGGGMGDVVGTGRAGRAGAGAGEDLIGGVGEGRCASFGSGDMAGTGGVGRTAACGGGNTVVDAAGETRGFVIPGLPMEDGEVPLPIAGGADVVPSEGASLPSLLNSLYTLCTIGFGSGLGGTAGALPSAMTSVLWLGWIPGTVIVIPLGRGCT